MGLEDGADSPGWVQLTYTSADSRDGSPGGWGVKEVVAGASADVVSELRLGVTTRIDEVVETSSFASEAQLRDRPRRLLAKPVDDRVLMWHAAAAGQDATGRPGNVFTHAARQRDHAPHLRPVEYWRSASWLAPFGPTETAAARLPEDLLVGTVVTRRTVERFVREDMQRLLVLEWLVAATAHALDRGVTLALGVETPDEGALWLGAISYLTSPAQARRLSWVTFERAAGISELVAQGITIVCVPRGDVAALRTEARPDVLVLDMRWSVEEDGSTWRTPDASFPAAAEWQNAMLDAFALGSSGTVAVLERLDQIAGRLTGAEARRLPLSWPLCMALVADGREVEDRAGRVTSCLARTPPSLMDTDEVRALLQEICSSPGAIDSVLAVPDLSPAVTHELGWCQVQTYLEGGWRSGDEPPLLSTGTAELLKSRSTAIVSEALVAAVVASASRPDLVPACVALVTFVVGNDLDPPPESDSAETSEGRDAVESLLARIGDRGVPMSDQERRIAREALLRVSGMPEPAAVVTFEEDASPQPALDASQHPTSAGVGPSDAGTIRPRLQKVPADPPPPRRPDPAREPAPPMPPADRPVTAATLPMAVDVAMSLMLDAAPAGSDRSNAIVDCMLVLRGLWQVPLRGGFPGITAARDAASDLIADPRHRRLHHRLFRWLIVYWALAELGEAEPGAQPSVVPREVLELDTHEREEAIEELAAFLEDPTTHASVAHRFVQHAKMRDLDPDRSLLGQPLGRGETLGWAAVRSAFDNMDEARKKEIGSPSRRSRSGDWAIQGEERRV